MPNQRQWGPAAFAYFAVNSVNTVWSLIGEISSGPARHGGPQKQKGRGHPSSHKVAAVKNEVGGTYSAIAPERYIEPNPIESTALPSNFPWPGAISTNRCSVLVEEEE